MRKMKPGRQIVLGFLLIIVFGTILLSLPVSAAEASRIPLTDSFFMATSAVCVTGLASVDPGTTFSMFGQSVLGVLIQIGGLGITSIGVVTILLASGRVSMGEKRLMKEALNLSSGKGIWRVIAAVFYVTLGFETAGAVVSYFVFSQQYDAIKAVGVSIFHSIAAFNNAGFDILGNFQSLTAYRNHVVLNAVTCILIIFGGLGFFVFTEIVTVRSWKKLSLHSKVVLSTTAALLLSGTILFKITEGTSWLAAFFQSTTARTAGFATENLGNYTNAGVLILMVLMFIGASPGSTGGGIKTTTFFVLIKKLRSITENWNCDAFQRKIPEHVVMKAFSVVTLALTVILVSTFLVCMAEPQMGFREIVFEVVSAFATTGLSLGITPELGSVSKIILTVTMFIGRLGPLTMATIWLNRLAPTVSYSEEEVTIG